MTPMEIMDEITRWEHTQEITDEPKSAQDNRKDATASTRETTVSSSEIDTQESSSLAQYISLTIPSNENLHSVARSLRLHTTKCFGEMFGSR